MNLSHTNAGLKQLLLGYSSNARTYEDGQPVRSERRLHRRLSNALFAPLLHDGQVQLHSIERIMDYDYFVSFRSDRHSVHAGVQPAAVYVECTSEVYPHPADLFFLFFSCFLLLWMVSYTGTAVGC